MPRYYCSSRPPTFYNVPNEHLTTAREVWMPERRIPDLPKDFEAYALGWVEYGDKLDLYTVDHWSLFPADRKEWAELVFYRRLGRAHVETIDEYRKMFAEVPLEDLREQAACGDYSALAELILRGLA